MNLFKIFKKDLILEMTMGCSCLLFGRAFVADLPIFLLEFLFFIFLCLSAVCYLITSAHKSLPLQVVVSNNFLKVLVASCIFLTAFLYCSVERNWHLLTLKWQCR